MRIISSEEFKNIINESVKKVIREAGMMPPKPLAPKPLAPKPLAPKPLGAQQGAGATDTTLQQIPNNPPVIQGQDDAPKPFKGGPAKDGIRLGVAGAKYENFFETTDPNETDKEVFKIWIDYVNDVQAQRWINSLNQNFGDILFATKIAKTKAEKKSGFSYYIKLIARPDKLNDFVKEIPNIVDSLYSMPTIKNRMTGFSISYDPTFKDEFEQRMKDFATKSVSEKDIENVNIKIAENWMDLLSDLKNPATLSKLRNISGIVYSSVNSSSAQPGGEINGDNVKGDNGRSAGHQLSFRNKIEIFSQNPNATFVTQEFVWRNVFNHEVIDPSDYILVTVPSNNKNVTKADRDAAARKTGYQGGYDEFKTLKKRGEIQGGESHALKMQANLHAQGTPFYSVVKMYDVSNTRPIPGLESKFLPGPNQERNLENNILGIPNAAAKSFSGSTSQSTADTQPIDTAPISDDPSGQLDMIRDSMGALVQRETGGSLPPSSGDVNRDIVNYAYKYAQFLLKSAFQGISKPETQEAFCQGFAAAVSISVTGMHDDKAADYLSRVLSNRGKDSKLNQLVVQWHNEYVEFLTDVINDVRKKLKRQKPLPVKKVVEEDYSEGANVSNINILSLNDFKELFGIGGDEQIYEEQEDIAEPQELKESFFKFLDKMEKSW